MEIILHLGAHRTASTSFQYYLRKNGARLAASGIGVWGPCQTRNGLMEGVLPRPDSPARPDHAARAQGRIAYKTGTSYGHRDALSVGYDGRFVAGVWIGRPDGTPVPGQFGLAGGNAQCLGHGHLLRVNRARLA